MDKLNMMSKDGVQENIEKIKALFPNAVTEVLRDGKPVLAVDFDVLKQEMSSVLIDDKEERYQFTWPDKKKSVLLANTPISATLRPCKEESVDFDNTENLYIEGDNLDVLKLLQETYLGKIKMIYIDPPYNTGNDFVYEDDFTADSADYLANSGQYDDQGNRLFQNTESNGRFHTDWLNMIYPRLKLAKDLLSDDGVIFISIDDNEQANLKKLCDEVFGEDNCVAIVPWQSRASIQNDTDFSVNHEYIIIYSRKRRTENRRLKEANYTIWKKRDSFVVRPLPLDESKFSNPDNDPRGKWKADPFDAPGVRENLSYEIVNSKTGQSYYPPKGRHWRMEKESYLKNLADDRIVFGASGDARPQLKVFYEEKKEFGSIENSWFSANRIGTTTEGTKEVMDLFDGEDIFDMPKPVSLLSKLLYISNIDKDSIILDFFSGSSTTAHAVMQLNAEDGGKRKYIMVQFPEDLQKKYDKASGNEKKELENTIEFLKQIHKAPLLTEIGKERIRRAGEKIKEENPLTTANLDTGFRVLKLDSSNMKPVYYKPEDYTQDLLSGLEDNIKEDRTPMDLLFQVMLELGKPLSAKIEEKVIGGKKVFVVNDDDLIACFDSNITEEVVKQIALMKPLYVVFRDSSMANDSVNTNFEQIFATYSPNTIRKVL